MKAKEKAVRDAAAALTTAIAEAKEAGFTVNWPRRPEDLSFIEISETAASLQQTSPPAPKSEPGKK